MLDVASASEPYLTTTQNTSAQSNTQNASGRDLPDISGHPRRGKNEGTYPLGNSVKSALSTAACHSTLRADLPSVAHRSIHSIAAERDKSGSNLPDATRMCSNRPWRAKTIREWWYIAVEASLSGSGLARIADDRTSESRASVEFARLRSDASVRVRRADRSPVGGLTRHGPWQQAIAQHPHRSPIIDHTGTDRN